MDAIKGCVSENIVVSVGHTSAELSKVNIDIAT